MNRELNENRGRRQFIPNFIKKMAESDETKTSEELELEVVQLEAALQEGYGFEVSATYRCQKCHRLSIVHPGRSVKGCKKAPLADSELKSEFIAQIKTLKEVITRLRALMSTELALKNAEEKARYFNDMYEHIARRNTEALNSRLFLIAVIKDVIRVGRDFRRGKKLDEELSNVLEGAEQSLMEEAAKGLDAEDDYSPVLEELTLTVTEGEREEMEGRFECPEPMEEDVTTPKEGATAAGSTGGELLEEIDSSSAWEDASGVETDTGDSTVRKHSSRVTKKVVKKSKRAPSLTRSMRSLHMDAPTRRVVLRDDSKPADADDGGKEYPGFRDKIGVELKHKTGGNLCGGFGDASAVLKASKIITVNFGPGDTALTYLEKRRKFIGELETIYGEEEIYLLLGIFKVRAIALASVVDPLLEKTSYYRSFLHFLEEFEIQQYPTLRAEALAKFQDIKQGKKSVRQYYTEFVDLITILKWNGTDHLHTFQKGLTDERVKQMIQTRYYAPGEKTLAELERHATYAEGELRVNKAVSGPSQRQVASVKKVSGPPKRAKPKSVVVASAAVASAAVAPKERGKPAKSTNQPGKGRKAISAVKLNENFQKSDRFALARGWAKIMSILGVTGCYGCMGKTHNFDFQYTKCGKTCIFCKTPFDSKNGHPAIECPKMPKTREKVQNYQSGKWKA